MSDMPTRPTEIAADPEGPKPDMTRRYILVAAILLVIILVAAILLLRFVVPNLRGNAEPTDLPVAITSPSPVPTFTAAPTTVPTVAPTRTVAPSPEPTAAELLMLNPETLLYELESAGARPSTEWTGFFGQVLDAAGNPVAGVPVVVWYPDPEGRLAAGPVETQADGSYEVRVADAPHQGTWSVQLLTADLQPASNLMTFGTDTDTTAGVQQIQVIWRQVSP